jgi:transposase
LTVTVDVAPRDREVLESWLRSSSLRAGLAQRARIVLLAADGVAVKDIVERVGVSKPTVIGWKKRYAAEGLGGLEDRPKPGRRRVVDEAAVVSATLEPPPERLGVTHWSTRLLGAELGISHVWVGKIWRRWGLQPWRAETFKFSTGPQLAAKVRDVVGLYLNPPDKAIVLCVDEKSQVQALDRPRPRYRCGWVCRRNRLTTTSVMAPQPCSPHWRSRPAASSRPVYRGTATRSS